MKCGSAHPKAIKAAQEFPAKLYAVHGDKIVLRDTAVYTNSKEPIDVVCSVCRHEWIPSANHLLKGHGCPECKRLKTINSAGKVRKPRPTQEEKQRAIELNTTGMSCAAVAQQLFNEGLSPQLRSKATINIWTNPEQAEKDRQRAAKWREDPVNREQHNASKRRYKTEFAHGRAGDRANSSHRRLLKTNTPEFVLLDGEWFEVDRRETYRVFSEILLPAKERKAIQEIYLEAQYLTETTGIEHHVDHAQPLSKGGEHLLFNLQILTAEENLSKQNTFRPEDQAELCRRLFNAPK